LRAKREPLIRTVATLPACVKQTKTNQTLHSVSQVLTLGTPAGLQMLNAVLNSAANGYEPKFDFSAGTFFTLTLLFANKICT